MKMKKVIEKCGLKWWRGAITKVIGAAELEGKARTGWRVS